MHHDAHPDAAAQARADAADATTATALRHAFQQEAQLHACQVASWRETIVQRAVADAAAQRSVALPLAPPRLAKPPRWLLGAWAAAWAAIVVLSLVPVPATSMPGANALSQGGGSDGSTSSVDTTLALVAYHRALLAP